MDDELFLVLERVVVDLDLVVVRGLVNVELFPLERIDEFPLFLSDVEFPLEARDTLLRLDIEFLLYAKLETPLRPALYA